MFIIIQYTVYIHINVQGRFVKTRPYLDLIKASNICAVTIQSSLRQIEVTGRRLDKQNICKSTKTRLAQLILVHFNVDTQTQNEPSRSHIKAAIKQRRKIAIYELINFLLICPEVSAREIFADGKTIPLENSLMHNCTLYICKSVHSVRLFACYSLSCTHVYTGNQIHPHQKERKNYTKSAQQKAAQDFTSQGASVKNFKRKNIL